MMTRFAEAHSLVAQILRPWEVTKMLIWEALREILLYNELRVIVLEYLIDLWSPWLSQGIQVSKRRLLTELCSLLFLCRKPMLMCDTSLDRALLFICFACLPHESDSSLEILKLACRLSKVDDLSDSDSVFVIEDLIGSDKLTTVLFKFLAPLCESHSLLSRRRNCNLNWLIVLYIDVVLVSLHWVLSCFFKVLLISNSWLGIGAFHCTICWSKDVLLHNAWYALILLSVRELLLHLTVQTVYPVLGTSVAREAPVPDWAIVVWNIPISEGVFLTFNYLRLLLFYNLFLPNFRLFHLKLKRLEIFERFEIILV